MLAKPGNIVLLTLQVRPNLTLEADVEYFYLKAKISRARGLQQPQTNADEQNSILPFIPATEPSHYLKDQLQIILLLSTNIELPVFHVLHTQPAMFSMVVAGAHRCVAKWIRLGDFTSNFAMRSRVLQANIAAPESMCVSHFYYHQNHRRRQDLAMHSAAERGTQCVI